MAKINDTGPHSAELVDELGRPFAVIQFNAKTNAASRREELLDGAEHWCNGGEGTSEFRLAARLRALITTKLSSQEDTKSRQQLTEHRLLDALNNYVKFFRDPANASRKREPTPENPNPAGRVPPHMRRR
jgi:hypothetical protein